MEGYTSEDLINVKFIHDQEGEMKQMLFDYELVPFYQSWFVSNLMVDGENGYEEYKPKTSEILEYHIGYIYEDNPDLRDEILTAISNTNY